MVELNMRKYNHIIRCVGDNYWLWDNYTQFWQEVSESKAKIVAALLPGLPSFEEIKAEAYQSVRFDLFTEQLIFED
jgi:uncharacterized iron-regulated protein